MKNLKFKRYNSIENTYRKKTLDVIVEQGKSQGLFVVEEKVHGANFQIMFDGGNFRCAKRSAFIKEGESFFNYEKVLDKYKENVINLFDHLTSNDENIKVISVCGELFGGTYPHDDVEKTDSPIIQRGLFYSPENDFYAFDIKTGNGEEELEFLNVDVCNELFEKFDFFYAKPLFKGTLKECIEYNNFYISLIPEWLGLPKIDENTCEGNVIKPMEVKYFWNGSRVILKNKNEKFSEKKNNVPKIKKVINLSDEANKCLANAMTFITENRLRNVLSHLGEINERQFGKIMGAINKDTIEDYLKEFREEFSKLDKKEAKLVTKRIGQENANMIRENFIDIVNGEY
ncbi:MAG: RnlB-B RNA ligase 2 [uncultured marine phage]|uniref:RNA ligase (ATP) n=1 Tax=uncultured marine phage TaxID=707152 RepID=A0A8D9CCI5_9VIRU|nr:MAG: RnlB-B RNA ligase 2 [uncultured marine phage]